jgi:toluene monooxygenase system ferredoxin subunit
MAFVPVAALVDLREGDMAGIVADGRKVLIVKLDGTVRAYEDRCAHLGVPLSEGKLEGHVLTCAAHHYEYDARTGQGINPRAACMTCLPVRIDGGQVLVDVAHLAAATKPRDDRVGPVLTAGEATGVVLAAIRDLNQAVEVQDRGAYVRVLVPGRCVLARAAVERGLGRPFRLPGDLEMMMPSFSGSLRVTDDEAVWTA